jgi:hypothetical protein
VTDVTLLARTVSGTDADGNDVYSTASSTLTGCILWPRMSTETVQGQDQVIAGLMLLVPPGVTVKATDRVQVGADVYEVDGQAGSWVSPFTGWAPGNEVALVKVTG